MDNSIHEFLDKAAAQNGDKVAAIDFEDRHHSWSDLSAATKAAEAVLKSYGVVSGDRVVLIFENAMSVPAFLFAGSRLDAMIVLMNARMSAAELDRVFAHSEPKCVVLCLDASAAAHDHAHRMDADFLDDVFGRVAVSSRSGASPEVQAEKPGDKVAVLLYTSGTTGLPKAAMLTQGNLVAAAYATLQVRQLDDCSVVYLGLPLSHVFGLVTLLAAAAAQSSIRLEARFDVERLYDALQLDVTHLPAVPQMHAHLFHYAQRQNKPNYDRGLLQFVSSGGAPLDPVYKREAEKFYGLPLQNGYGLTEGSAGVCATKSTKGDPDVSVGVPMGECQIRINFEAYGAEPDEGIGELEIGGPQIMKGYFRDPDQTRKILTDDGFFRTGDLGRFDEHGRLHITGRSKELIIRSGFNVYPIEVEAALAEHPKVIVAGVVGRRVAGNEEVIGFVKTADPVLLSEDDLKEFVRDKLAPYKRPARIVIADDLPAAATGKLMKAKLLDHFADVLSCAAKDTE